MKTIIKFFTSRGLWVFLGILAIVLIIWFVGPLVSVGNYRPLSSKVVRIGLCVGIFVIWVGRFVFRKYREAKQNALLLAEIKASSQESLLAVERKEDSELTQQFSEMTNLLKKTKFAKKGTSGLTRAINGQYIYQMPWYLFIGASGSGKTTALKNSGLNFPLAGEFGLSMQSTTGTKNCDWVFSDEAVLLDTAGRYISQDSNRNQDEKDWSEFLTLLKKYRPKQPVNGVVLTVSVEDLLQDSGEKIRQQTTNIRKRLQELREKTGIDFPVYLTVTKTDLLAGFSPYFSSLIEEERKQVWGFTLPLVENIGTKEGQDEADFYTKHFNAEYILLVERLNKGLPKIIQGLDSVDERAGAFLLPQEFLGLQASLSQFVREVFKISKYEHNINLRGVYFTSGTQTGNEISPLADEIKNQLSLQDKYVVDRAPVKERKNYFLTNLFEKVVFPEANLASVNKKWFRTQIFLYWGGMAVVCLLTVMSLLFLTNSFFNNRTYLETVDKNAAVLSDQLQKQKEPPNLFEVLKILDQVRGLSKTEEILDPNVAKWSYRFGLYQGRDVDAVVVSTYRKILQDNVLPTVASEIDGALRNAPENDPDYIYEALKAYLMMYNKDKFNDKFIQSWLLFNIEKKQGNKLAEAQIKSLEGHLTELLSGNFFSSPLLYDQALVESKRNIIAKDTLSVRAYSRIKKLLESTEGESSVSFVQMGGPQTPLLFKRASNRPLTEYIPMAYTVEGYRQSFLKLLGQEFSSLFDDEQWVLGSLSSAASATDKVRITKEIQDLYFDDYISTWKAYISDLRMKQPANLRESIQMARLLSDQSSPLLLMIEGISKNTHLESNAAKAVTDAVGKKVDKEATRVLDRANMRQLLGDSRPDAAQIAAAVPQPEKVVGDQFIEFYQLTYTPSEGKSASINEIIQSINDLYVYLVAVQVAVDRGVELPPEEALIKYKADIDRLPEPFRSELDKFSTFSSSNVSTTANAKLVDSLTKGVKNISVTCAELKTQGYPFVKADKLEVSLEDFTAVFGADGSYGQYYANMIQSKVNQSDMSLLQSSADAQKLLTVFQSADEIRKMYFQEGGKQPSISFEVKVVKLDEKTDNVRLTIGGQSLMYEHGPQVPITFKWPAQGKEDQVRLQLTPLNEKGQTSAVAYNGSWAVFRLFENAKISQGQTPNSALVSVTLANRNVVFEITSKSRNTPFILNKLRDFQCS